MSILVKRGRNASYTNVSVDDLLIAEKDVQIREIIQRFRTEYELIDLEEANHYLGIKIYKIDEKNSRWIIKQK